MIKPNRLHPGDKVAIVSLSGGILGEISAKHQLKLGTKRLKSFKLNPVIMPNALKGLKFLQDHPEARAQDLKIAFLDQSIKGIICVIGGDDTYRLLPYLLNDSDFIRAVQTSPQTVYWFFRYND